MKNLNRQDLIY